ncbi:hypothetical protein ACFVZN_18000, partial [Streptomyces virginiae]
RGGGAAVPAGARRRAAHPRRGAPPPAPVSTKDADWNEKLDVYGRLVPIYLVVDMQDSEITCFHDPSPHGYRARTTVSFGEPLHVPAPFDFAVDTTGF